MSDLPIASELDVNSSALGQELLDILASDSIQPGSEPSYQLCKAIYIFHPLGGKMAESPIRLAQSQDREIAVPDSPEDECLEAYHDEWKKLEASRYILNERTQARIYGIAATVMGCNSKSLTPDKAIKPEDLWKADLFFNVLDPLNTAGSLTMGQDPNSALFQKHGDLVVQGTRYHRSRSNVVMNEESIYIQWTTSAFGYVGRSVYQRALFPLKSFIQTMKTDDLVTIKAGVFVSKQEQPGSIIDRAMKGLFGVKRGLLKAARTGNVLSIGLQENIETLNMRNIDAAIREARNNIIKNIATANDMPAKLLTQESFVEGFGEGTQDAYAVSQYIDRLRIEMGPSYDWWDGIAMRRAWNPEFYERIQKKYPDEYGEVSYRTAFYKWQKSFKATWPNLIKEPPSDLVNVDKVKLAGVIEGVTALAPMLDPVNKAKLVEWAVDNMNTNEELFQGAKFVLDTEELIDWLVEQQAQAEQQVGGDEGDVDDSGLEQERVGERPLGRMSLVSGDSVATVRRLVSRVNGGRT